MIGPEMQSAKAEGSCVVQAYKRVFSSQNV